MKILLYKGHSAISKAIQWQTRSEYSHVAIELGPGVIVEAWHVGGVRTIRYPGDGHSPRTPVDIYRIDPFPGYDADKVRTFLMAQLGKKYDFKSVARFVSRRKTALDDRWFCSELCLAAFAKGGLDLLHVNHSEASPRDVSMSPYLHYENTTISY